MHQFLNVQSLAFLMEPGRKLYEKRNLKEISYKFGYMNMNVRKLQNILQIIFSISITDRYKVQDTRSFFSHCFAFLQNNISRNKKFIAEMFISSASAHNIENKTT